MHHRRDLVLSLLGFIFLLLFLLMLLLLLLLLLTLGNSVSASFENAFRLTFRKVGHIVVLRRDSNQPDLTKAVNEKNNTRRRKPPRLTNPV